MSQINLYPTKCNLCGGPVIYTSNAVIYHGKTYGSGKCYLCKNCGAYVGTHAPRPKEALGLLADSNMRKGKILCHEIFDSFWKGKNKAHKKREDLYKWLAEQMQIPIEECHFGWFSLEELRSAYSILVTIKDKSMQYDNNGRIYFE